MQKAEFVTSFAPLNRFRQIRNGPKSESERRFSMSKTLVLLINKEDL
jgi:hypothetical protein